MARRFRNCLRVVLGACTILRQWPCLFLLGVVTWGGLGIEPSHIAGQTSNTEPSHPMNGLESALRSRLPTGWRLQREGNSLRFDAADDHGDRAAIEVWFDTEEFTPEQEARRRPEPGSAALPPVIRFGPTRLGFAHAMANDVAMKTWSKGIHVIRETIFDSNQFRLPRPLRIRVVDARDGRPIAGVLLEAVRWHDPRDKTIEETVTTDQEGTARFQKLMPIFYRFQMQARSPLPWIPQNVGIEPDTDACEIRLKRACELVLRAVDSETGRGIGGVQFGRERALAEFWRQDIVPDTIPIVRKNSEAAAAAPARVPDSTTDADGIFRCLVDEATWSYSVAAFPPGYTRIVPIEGGTEVGLAPPAGARVEYTFRLIRTGKSP